MADSFLLQDWITIRGGSGGVSQPGNARIDTGGYTDAVVYLDVADRSNVQVLLQTAPTRESTLWKSMVAAFIPALGENNTLILASSAIVPLSSFMRWRLTPDAGGTFSLTFRAWVSLA